MPAPIAAPGKALRVPPIAPPARAPGMAFHWCSGTSGSSTGWEGSGAVTLGAGSTASGSAFAAPAAIKVLAATANNAVAAVDRLTLIAPSSVAGRSAIASECATLWLIHAYHQRHRFMPFR